MGWSLITKDFETQVGEARLVDQKEITLHFELKCDSLETCCDCHLGRMVWRVWMATYTALEYLGGGW